MAGRWEQKKRFRKERVYALKKSYVMPLMKPMLVEISESVDECQWPSWKEREMSKSTPFFASTCDVWNYSSHFVIMRAAGLAKDKICHTKHGREERRFWILGNIFEPLD